MECERRCDVNKEYGMTIYVPDPTSCLSIETSGAKNCFVIKFAAKKSPKNQNSKNFPIEQKTKILSETFSLRRLWLSIEKTSHGRIFPQILFWKCTKNVLRQRQQHCDHHPCHVIVLSFRHFFFVFRRIFLLSINFSSEKQRFFPLFFHRQCWVIDNECGLCNETADFALLCFFLWWWHMWDYYWILWLERRFRCAKIFGVVYIKFCEISLLEENKKNNLVSIPN